MANFVRRFGSFMQYMVSASVAFILLLLLAGVCTSARSSRATSDATCPVADIAVFPYWSACNNPAQYIYDGGIYNLASPETGLLLAPEWDETNSTYYVRLADKGALYAFSHYTKERRGFVTVSKWLNIVNVDTGRALIWRKEGEDEYFLVEVEGGGGDRFEFATYDNLNLACPLIYPPVLCKGYSIRDSKSSSGLSPYVEDDVTYFKKSATNLAAFTLLRPRTPYLRKNMQMASVM